MFPIIDRELRVAARRWGTYYGRLTSAALVLFLGGWIYWAFEKIGGTGFGAREIFLCITSMILAQCLLAGANRTADCLSQEKRDGTLGLLFLTDLKGYDIVLGKLLANSLATVYGLIATFPVLAIVLLIGGIAGREFWLVMLNLLNSLVFSLSIGLVISSVSKRQKRAATVSGLVMVFFGAVVPLLAEWIRHESPFPFLGVFLNWFSPVYTHRMAFSFSGPFSAQEYWKSFLVVLSMSSGCLAVASYVAPRSWQDRPARGRRLSLRECLAERRLGSGDLRRAFRAKALGVTPYFWLASRDRLSRFWLWFFFSVVALLDFFIFAFTEWDRVAIATLNTMVFTIVMKLLVVTTACHRFAEDRQNGALELLLSTPLGVRSIVRGQLLALARQFAAPLLVSILIPGALMWVMGASTGEYGGMGQDDVLTFLIYEAVSVVDMAALAWVGMWMALRVRLPAHASGAAFLRIVLVPYLQLAAVSTILVVLGFWREREAPTWWFTFLAYVGLALVNDAFFALASRAKLHAEFRLAATDRHQLEERSLWSRLRRKWRPQPAPRLDSLPSSNPAR